MNLAYSFEDSVVAIVNDQVILESELREKLETVNLENLNRIQLAKVRNDLLDQLVTESLMDQATARMGIRVSDIDLQNQIKAIAKNQGMTVLQLKDAIERENITYAKYLDKLRRNIRREELFRTQFTNRAYVSEEEISSYLKNNELPDMDGRMDIKEYVIYGDSETLNLSQAKILLNNIKIKGLEESMNEYPNFEIQTETLNNVQVHNLPDIYQSNLQVLDKDQFSSVFKTGKGFTILEVLKSNVLTDEYKVSHILMKTNPMEDSKEIKKKFYEIKQNVTNGDEFSRYAEDMSLDKASAIRGGSLGWITRERVVGKFGEVMINTQVGEISEPFETKFGWHILFLEDKRTKNILDTIKRNQAITILKERKVDVAKKEWLAKLKDQAYIEYIE